MKAIKGIILLLSIAFTTVATMCLVLWQTRSAAIPGSYTWTGVSGSSRLAILPDHTFRQEVHFVNPYSGRDEGTKVIIGHWYPLGRDFFHQRIDFSPFKDLASYEGTTHGHFVAEYGPVALTGIGIEIDIGAGIVYRK